MFIGILIKSQSHNIIVAVCVLIYYTIKFLLHGRQEGIRTLKILILSQACMPFHHLPMKAYITTSSHHQIPLYDGPFSDCLRIVTSLSGYGRLITSSLGLLPFGNSRLRSALALFYPSNGPDIRRVKT